MMSFTMTERSESPPRSSGLSQIFHKAKNRDSKARDSASDSMRSSESDGHRGARGPLENAIDKIKGNNGAEEDGDTNGIKKLVPKGIGARRRKKKQEREDAQRENEEAARGRSVADRGTLENDSGSVVPESGDGSSVITYESDTES